MMSGATIRELSRQAAQKAARERKIPLIVENEDIEDAISAIGRGRLPRFNFPFLGSYVPKGWERTTRTADDSRNSAVDDGEQESIEYFVDSSGVGEEGEPALTIKQLVDKLRPGFGYAVTEAGQFQVYVGEYRKL